jgi:hypothetical protein
MSAYKLILTDEDGIVIDQWSISTEYDYDVEDINDEGKHDMYVTEKECKRPVYIRYKGEDIGEQVIREIIKAENWK